MANVKQAKAKRLGMAERAEQMMNLQFPDVQDGWLWRRNANHGYTTAPRTLPIAMQAIDAQSKGQPAGHVLFCLWARSPDHPLVTIENPAIFAAEAGFDGNRAVDTWRRRMKTLRTLKFIDAREGASGDFHYVLLLNPNSAMHAMFEEKKVQTGLYARFMERMAEVGAMPELEKFKTLFRREMEERAEPAAMAQPKRVRPEKSSEKLSSEPTPRTAGPSKKLEAPKGAQSKPRRKRIDLEQ